MDDNTTQVSSQINSAVNNALGVGALAAIYTGNFVNFGKVGGALALIEKTITENGVYNATNDGADGYNVVTVNVNGIEILAGRDEPSNDIGDNGQLYLKTIQNPVNWRCNADYYVIATDVLLDIQSGSFYKTVYGPAIGVHYYTGSYYGPILISTVADYVKMSPNNTGTPFSADIDGVTWYMSTANNWGGSDGSKSPLPQIHDQRLAVSQGNALAIISKILEDSSMEYDSTVSDIITDVYYKKENWQTITGAELNDINLGGE